MVLLQASAVVVLGVIATLAATGYLAVGIRRAVGTELSPIAPQPAAPAFTRGHYAGWGERMLAACGWGGGRVWPPSAEGRASKDSCESCV